MAVQLKPREVESRLFCMSKFWGDPDMPADMPYPMMKYTVDGKEYEYPLTFVCQLDCADLYPFIGDVRFPEEGMLYFFAALDPYLGYDAPGCGPGEWPKAASVVKYTKLVNPETFESYESLDEEGESTTNLPWAIDFAACEPGEDVFRMFGKSEEGQVELLRLISYKEMDLDFGQAHELVFSISEKDLGFGNWKKHQVFLR